ncbi:hypothetical protein F4778DRAFT_169369 [Xylariomycetidae sp. FL2044]|nr:hypothetical protein F4778DRAFT_169369 [Xylariomycetidae sp. FL2044]
MADPDPRPSSSPSTPAAAMEPCDETPPMRCCCGSLECVVLRHNCSLLDSVEKDVHHAATMGKALLARHEAYMEDAERDRNELTGRIEQLELDVQGLEIRNAKTIEENRSLLDQLEALNTTVNDSECRNKSLEAALLSSQQTIRRLERETDRAASLERQLIALEQEQEELQGHLSLSRDEARSAMSRWKRAERGINDLQEQLERIEKEAKEEREHHAEMMGRVEKQREVERELNTAAGRLKGAAAAKSLNQANGGSNAVSHFVRDLLQDNVSLQNGIAELREMLMNSNDEIQALRDQLMYHQPLGDDGEASSTPTLRAELEQTQDRTPDGNDESPKVSQELHIHHHYHVATPKQDARKPRKKRQGLTPGVFIPPAVSLPSTPPNGLVQQNMPNSKRDSMPSNRWSVYSEQPSDFAPSSVPSSPISNPRQSLFDPIMDSFPGSPTTSVDPMSPTFRATHRKQPSNMSARSFQVPTVFSLTPATPTQTQPIIEESDDTEVIPDLASTTDASTVDGETPSTDHETGHDEISIILEDTDFNGKQAPARLRRVLSHESIISLSGGLDIHTLKSRPNQLTLRHLNSPTSVASSSTVIARPMLSRESAKRSSDMLLDRYSSSPVASLRSVSSPSSAQQANESSKLGKWAGWRPWGGGSSPSSMPPSTTKTIREKDRQKLTSRPPGINQPGAIPGFSEYIAAAQKKAPPSVTRPTVVDQEALRDGLGQ